MKAVKRRLDLGRIAGNGARLVELESALNDSESQFDMVRRSARVLAHLLERLEGLTQRASLE